MICKYWPHIKDSKALHPILKNPPFFKYLLLLLQQAEEHFSFYLLIKMTVFEIWIQEAGFIE